MKKDKKKVFYSIFFITRSSFAIYTLILQTIRNSQKYCVNCIKNKNNCNINNNLDSIVDKLFFYKSIYISIQFFYQLFSNYITLKI